MKPYIGVSCFTDVEQLKIATTFLPEQVYHKFMVGLSVSYKSLRGLPLKNKWQKRMIEPQKINSLLLPDPRFLNIIHYSGDDPNYLSPDLFLLNHRTNEHLHGFQLNFVWPSVQIIEKIRRYFPDLILILNLFPPNLAAVDNNPTKLKHKLLPYRQLLDAVLIDSSGGQGQLLDPNQIFSYLSGLFDTGLGIGFAGGLTPDNLQLLEPLAHYADSFSIDAESGLRNEANELDLDKVQKYLSRAYRLLD